MFQAQEHAKEDGLRRVEASRTDADLGTLLATCPECRLYGQMEKFRFADDPEANDQTE